jgi:phosphoglycolate phosphatase
LRKGVNAALARFSKAGMRQVVLSASHLGDLRCQVAHFGIEDFFVDLLGMTDRNGSGKEEIGRDWAHRIRQTNGADTTMVLIGDTEHDAEVARQMGASCILVAGGHSAAYAWSGPVLLLWQTILPRRLR